VMIIKKWRKYMICGGINSSKNIPISYVGIN
jgi:hypothetical protein